MEGACAPDATTDAADQLRLLAASFDDAHDLPDLRRARAILETRVGGACHIANL
jgi:hypothetical protein